jgi:hypothetical protein
MSNVESDILIAITGMIVLCVVLIGIPLVLMLGKPFRLRKKTTMSTS